MNDLAAIKVIKLEPGTLFQSFRLFLLNHSSLRPEFCRINIDANDHLHFQSAISDLEKLIKLNLTLLPCIAFFNLQILLDFFFSKRYMFEYKSL